MSATVRPVCKSKVIENKRLKEDLMVPSSRYQQVLLVTIKYEYGNTICHSSFSII